MAATDKKVMSREDIFLGSSPAPDRPAGSFVYTDRQSNIIQPASATPSLPVAVGSGQPSPTSDVTGSHVAIPDPVVAPATTAPTASSAAVVTGAATSKVTTVTKDSKNEFGGLSDLFD